MVERLVEKILIHGYSKFIWTKSKLRRNKKIRRYLLFLQLHYNIFVYTNSVFAKLGTCRTKFFPKLDFPLHLFLHFLSFLLLFANASYSSCEFGLA